MERAGFCAPTRAAGLTHFGHEAVGHERGCVLALYSACGQPMAVVISAIGGWGCVSVVHVPIRSLLCKRCDVVRGVSPKAWGQGWSANSSARRLLSSRLPTFSPNCRHTKQLIGRVERFACAGIHAKGLRLLCPSDQAAHAACPASPASQGTSPFDARCSLIIQKIQRLLPSDRKSFQRLFPDDT